MCGAFLRAGGFMPVSKKRISPDKRPHFRRSPLIQVRHRIRFLVLSAFSVI
jgi:hypothetical protein